MDTRDRIVGCMLGLACGDALGAPAEFRSREEIAAVWGRLTEMTAGGPWAAGEWTDDTGMALCVAEGILESPEDPVEEIGRRFLQWAKTAKDVGSTVQAALNGFQGDWAEASKSTPQVRRGEAAGNGSLMRAAPVALAYPDSDSMLLQSARISAMTHWDPQAEVCCAVYCLWITGMLSGANPAEGWRQALASAKSVLPERLPDTPGPSPLPERFWDRLAAAQDLDRSDLQPSGYAGYVVECLEAAVWLCLHADSLEETLVEAVNLGGEADTIAAVAGGAAGAFYGTSAIPSRWLDALLERERILRAAEELADLRSHLDFYARGALPFHYVALTDRLFAGRNPLTARDVTALQKIGITHILDLREESEWTGPGMSGSEALAAAASRGITRAHCPVPDTCAPDAQTLSRTCSHLEAWLGEPESRVYVHCRAGQERTACVLAAHLARSKGLNYEEALSELRAASELFQPLKHQEAAVREWVETQLSGPESVQDGREVNRFL